MQQKIYNMLMVTHRSLLKNCFEQVFFSDSEVPAVKTFDDYLTDFYLYLYEGKPKYVKEDVKGYYLQQIRDEKALPGWLRMTFRNFLLEENKVIRFMQESLSDYRRELDASLNGKNIDLTLMHVAFAIACFNQNESSEDRYLFFRSAYKHFKGFYTWPDTDLDDKDVANALGIEQGTLRTRTSRLCVKVKRMVRDVNDAYIATLNKQALDIAKEIYDTPNPDIESLLERLLGEAERELPQYEQIVALKKSKFESLAAFEQIKDSFCVDGVTKSISVEKCVRLSYSEMAECIAPVCHIEKSKDYDNNELTVNLEKRYIDIDDLEDECLDDEDVAPTKPSQTDIAAYNRIVRIFKSLIESGDTSSS